MSSDIQVEMWSNQLDTQVWVLEGRSDWGNKSGIVSIQLVFKPWDVKMLKRRVEMSKRDWEEMVSVLEGN